MLVINLPGGGGLILQNRDFQSPLDSRPNKTWQMNPKGRAAPEKSKTSRHIELVLGQSRRYLSNNVWTSIGRSASHRTPLEQAYLSRVMQSGLTRETSINFSWSEIRDFFIAWSITPLLFNSWGIYKKTREQTRSIQVTLVESNQVFWSDTYANITLHTRCYINLIIHMFCHLCIWFSFSIVKFLILLSIYILYEHMHSMLVR